MKSTQEKFSRACAELGAEIVQRGHSIMVTSYQEETADYAAVNGIIESIENKKLEGAQIFIHRRQHARDPFQQLAEKHPNVFRFLPGKQPTLGATHLITLRKDNAIVIIGGTQASYNADLAAILANKKAVPVGSFGGAAGRLLGLLDEVSSSGNTLWSRIDITKLGGPWTQNVLSHTLEQIGINDFPKILIVHGKGDDWKIMQDYLQQDLNVPKPIEMAEKYGRGKTLTEKFEYLASTVHGAIIIITPDDIGALAVDEKGHLIPPESRAFSFRARENVWVELGWFWGKLGRKRIMIFMKGKVNIPSDIAQEYYGYQEKPNEKNNKEAIQSFINALRG